MLIVEVSALSFASDLSLPLQIKDDGLTLQFAECGIVHYSVNSTKVTSPRNRNHFFVT